MAELVVGEKRRVCCRGAFCRPACPGAGRHLRRGNHGHIRGLSPLQDGVEGYCPFGAGQAGCWLYEVLCWHPEHRQALVHRAEDGRLFQQTLPAVRARNGHPDRALLSSLLRRMPELDTLEIMKLVNCPETFTPDMRCILGESPLVQGYFVLAGMNSAGISFGGGAGRFSEEGEDSLRCQHVCPSGRG
ncbi:uncharacterized protein LOC144309239 isoform X2 [Canis aureus]